ncbi:MAG: SAM-dependent methyltransferase [bacterium]|nr:SAM-dependent methyltransferase [bacterium]
MIEIIFTVSAIFLGLFAFVVFFGAPYLPTRKEQIESSLDLLDLKKGQLLVELGSGDGRVLKAAGKRDIKAVGYEINPILVIISKIITFRYRKLVNTRWKSMWKADISQADGVYVFLLDRFMQKLDNKMKKEVKTGTKLISFAFKIKGKKISKKKKGLFLYLYS